MKARFKQGLYIIYQNSISILILSILLFLAVLSNFLFITRPEKLMQVYNNFNIDKPKTLSSLETYMFEKNIQIKVSKRKTRQGLDLEFRKKEGDFFNTVNTISLKGSKEAHFKYLDGFLSLASIDIDGDGSFEVIAPSFDSFLKPQLDVIFYNSQTKKFELQKKLLEPPVLNL